MQRRRHQFLTGSARASNKRRSVMRCNAPDSGEHLKHERTPSDHAFELVGLEEFVIQLQRRLALLRFRNQFSNSVP